MALSDQDIGPSSSISLSKSLPESSEAEGNPPDPGQQNGRLHTCVDSASGFPRGDATTLPLSRDEAVCSICLGVLQTMDQPAAVVGPELRLALSESDGGGAFWQPLPSGSLKAIATHVR